MHRRVLVLAFMGGAVMASLAAQASAFQFKSFNVELPQGDRMFTGAGADAVNNNCLACHSAGMVLNQPALPKATWEAEVHKMITTYKAPVDEQDVAAIVEYLVKTKGKN